MHWSEFGISSPSCRFDFCVLVPAINIGKDDKISNGSSESVTSNSPAVTLLLAMACKMGDEYSREKDVRYRERSKTFSRTRNRYDEICDQLKINTEADSKPKNVCVSLDCALVIFGS
jgi:hypothetical protein